MNIFKLFGSVFVDTDKADKSIAKTDKKAQGLGATFVKGAKTVGKFGAVLGGAAIAGGAAIVALGKKVGDNADRLLDMASATGMSTDEIQKWEQVATVAGVSANTMTKASEKLTKSMDIMSTGTGKAAEAAETLGFSYDQLLEMNADERMNAITEALGGVEDGTERAKLGTDLLGNSWAEVAPIIDVGAEAMKDIKDNATIMSPEDLEAANNFRISMDQMKEKALLLGQSLLMKLMPTLNNIFDWIGAHMPEIESFFTKTFDIIGNVVTVTVAVFNTYLLPVLERWVLWVKDNMPQIKLFFENAFDGIKKVVEVAIDVFNNYLMPALKVFWELVKVALPIIKVIFEESFNIIKALVMSLWDIFQTYLLPVLKVVFEWVQEHLPEIKMVFETVFKVIGIVIVTIIDTIKDLIGVFVDVFNFTRDVFSGIGNLIMSAFDGVTKFIDGIVDKFNKVKDTIMGAIDAVKNFVGVQDEVDNSNMSSSGLNTTDISGLATGGTTLTSGVIKVGERGPELLSVPKGAQVSPMVNGMGPKIEMHIHAENIVGQDAGDELGEMIVDALERKGVFV